MGEWKVDVISFQKIFGFCGLKGHIIEIREYVTLVDGRTDNGQWTTDNGQRTECEDRARILGSRIRNMIFSHYMHQL